MLRGVSEAFPRIARQLMRRRGVVGVFWGSRHPGHTGRPHLRVHVIEKLPEAKLSSRRLLRERIEGVPVRVIQVGHPRAHVISSMQLATPASDERTSTVTALAPGERGWLALCSGHGTLPLSRGQLVTAYSEDDEFDLKVTDITTDAQYGARLVAGGLSDQVDWAVLATQIPADANVDITSPAADVARPALRTTSLVRNEPLTCYSCLDHRINRATVVAYGRVLLLLPDQQRYLYTSVIEVHGVDAPFTRPGDSGSLVVDDAHRAVGIVLGAADPDVTDRDLGYVLPLASLARVAGARLGAFFRL